MAGAAVWERFSRCGKNWQWKDLGIFAARVREAQALCCGGM
eukprot:symbB.v1.2.019492.t1/scaffold1595.1/size109920/1